MRVPKFSKFLHGMALLFPDSLQVRGTMTVEQVRGTMTVEQAGTAARASYRHTAQCRTCMVPCTPASNPSPTKVGTACPHHAPSCASLPPAAAGDAPLVHASAGPARLLEPC